MIKAVLFDVGGVLHETNTAVGDDLQKELGLTPDQIKKIFKNQVVRMGLGQLDEFEFWREISEEYGIRVPKTSERLLSRAFESELKQNKRLLNIAIHLRKEGIKIAILSDTNVLHAEVLTKAGSYEPFEYRFLSFETGFRKPDHRAYENALNTLEVRPEDTVFIDDDKTNVREAQSIGIKGIVFRNNDQLVSELSALLPDIDLELK